MGCCWLFALDGTLLLTDEGDAVWRLCANCWWAGDARACAYEAVEYGLGDGWGWLYCCRCCWS
jgi:hypothetical protein